MGCCGDREKQEEGTPEQKWNYLNLSDFKSSSCGPPFSYGILYCALLISVAVYVIDIFTAANLLFFDRWSGQVQPVIPLVYARWIFAGCIILSWVLLIYRWMRAIKMMRSGIVGASYLDPLAVRVQSVRMGKQGRGWRRFLVFAALTKGRKGAEYVALFTFFSFEAWLRIVFAEGPRQLINAATLYTVFQANLVPTGQHAATGSNSSIGQFFVNIQILAASNHEQATVLFGMLFTLVIWLFSALGLMLAVVFYVFFLWNHIPTSDGSLARYCRRKVDKRLSQIVGVKINKAIERENRQRLKEDGKSDGRSLRHQPTLPVIGDEKSGLSRHTSESSSLTGSWHGSDDQRRPSALPGLNRPSPPLRMASQMSSQSAASYTSNAPLMVAASAMGYEGAGRPHSPMASEHSYPRSKPGLSRLQTQSTQKSRRSYGTNWSGPTPTSPSQIPLGPHNGVSPHSVGIPQHSTTISSRTATPASFRSQPQSRKPIPRSAPERQDSYEMYFSNSHSRVVSPTASAYTAYNPAARVPHDLNYDPYSPRTATAPPEQQSSNLYDRSSPQNYFGRDTPRSGTARATTGRASTSAVWAAQRGVMDRY